jgi:hypothetical protein
MNMKKKSFIDSTKEYHFNVLFAVLFGTTEAILINNLKFWILKNRANESEEHFHKGHWWTYNSIRAFQELFPMWSEKQISGALTRLKKKEIIITGNFNQSVINHTKWYAFKNEEIFLDGEIPKSWLKGLKSKIDFPSGENRISPEGKSYNKTYKNHTYKNPISKEIVSDSGESPFGLSTSPKKIYPHLDKLKDLLKRGGFRTQTERPSKVLDRTFKYIEQIRSGKFTECEWDPAWKNKNNIDFSPISKLKGLSHEEIYKTLSRAFFRFGRMKTDEKVWPEDKDSLKKVGLDVFIYNSRTQKSWMLYCLNNAPSSLGSLSSVDRARLISCYSGIESIWSNVYNKTETKRWNNSQWTQFIGCVMSLERWWKNNRSTMELVNSGWVSIGRTFPAFLRTVMDYIQDCWAGDMRPYFMPMSGNRWNGFLQWVNNQYGVNLDPDDDVVEKAKKRKARMVKLREETKIQQEMDQIQKTLEANEQPSLGYDDLRQCAIESLKKKEAV